MEQQNDDFDQIIAGEFAGRTELVGRFDTCRIELSYQLTEVATQLDNDPKGHGTLEIDVREHRDIFKDLARDILMDTTDQADNIRCLVETIAVESQARTDMMSQILGREAFQSLTRETITEIMDHLVEDSDNMQDLLEKIANMYEIDLRQDIDAFIHFMLDKHGRHLGETPEIEEMTIEIKKGIKEHLTDVAKMAAGVTLALAADRLLRRKA